MTTHIILVPGFWLGAWAWDAVAEELVGPETRVTALTLPGLHSDDDRSAITIDDQAQAIIDVATPESVLVSHSGGALAAYAAIDRAPELFARAIYVDSGPLPDGFVMFPDAPGVEVPMPEWAEMAQLGNDLTGLDEAALARMRELAVPEPTGVTSAPLQLKNEARYQVPVTIICNSMPAAAVQAERDAGRPFGVELQKIDTQFVDLPTGHWPMFSKPKELAEVIAAAAS